MTSHSKIFLGDTKKDNCQKHGKDYDNLFLFGRWTGCPDCAVELVEALDKKREAEELEKRRAKILTSAYIPEMFANAGLKNYEVNSIGKNYALNNVRDYVNRLKLDPKTAGNLVMTGHTGNGKTHLAAAVLRVMAHDMRRVRYVTSAQIISECFATWDDKSKTIEQIVTHYASYDVLLIDEVGLNDCTTEKAQSYLTQIIDARYLAKRPTITTSNLFEDKFHKLLGDRSFDRLCENSLVIRFDWESYRQQSRRSGV